MNLNHVRQLMRLLYWSTWERVPTSYSQEPVVHGGTTHKPSWSRSGGGGVDGDGSGGQSPSRQGARTGTSDPQNVSSMAAELRNFSWNMTDWFRVFTLGAINRRKDDGRWCFEGPTPRGSAPGGGAVPWHGVKAVGLPRACPSGSVYVSGK